MARPALVTHHVQQDGPVGELVEQDEGIAAVQPKLPVLMSATRHKRHLARHPTDMGPEGDWQLLASAK